MASPSRARLLALIEEALEARVFSAVQAEIGLIDRPIANFALGHTAFAETTAAEPAQPVEPETPMDIASLTKAIAVGLVMKTAVERGELGLDTTLGALLELPDSVDMGDKAGVTCSQLLNHQAGFAAWRPFFEELAPGVHGTLEAREQIRLSVLREPLESLPGVCERYSDLGYIVLDAILEQRLGAPLDRLFAERVSGPLGLKHTGFVPVAGGRPWSDAVSTEVVDWRGGLVQGWVHDGNTWTMGGVSGHAGVFSTAAELGCIARELLAIDTGREGALSFSTETLHAFWDRKWRHEGGHHLLAWDTPSGLVSSAGRTVNREHAVGHLGFTGCSLWMDRLRGAYVVLLTNRVHPSRAEERLRDLRPLFHDEAWRLVDAT